MSTRHHRRLFWPFAVALLGTAACAGSSTKSPPVGSTQPGGGTEKPGGGTAQPGGGTTQPGGGTTQPGGGTVQPGAGPAQPGAGTPQPGGTGAGGRRGRIPGREARPTGGTEGPATGTQIDGICADVRTAADHAEKVAFDAMKCGSPEDASANDEIAGMLHAIHSAEVRESVNVEGNAQSEAVRAYAQLMIISHRRALAENQAMFERLSIRPDENAMNRGLEGGHLRGLSTVSMRGAELDREYMRRQILEHRRSVELIDMMLPRAQNADVRCALESTRHEAMTHLEMGCWIWDSLQHERGAGVERGARKSQRGQQVEPGMGQGQRGGYSLSVSEQGDDDDDCDEPGTSEQAGGEQAGGEQARGRQRQGIDDEQGGEQARKGQRQGVGTDQGGQLAPVTEDP